MFTNAITTAVVLAGAAMAQSTGSAIVINSCDYPVYLQNTPAADGGFSAISQTLNNGDSYSQTFTELTNGNGWSIKLSQTAGAFDDNIMQYEYTWLGWAGEFGGLIWYDLSDVNGNPWNGNWELTATGDCAPRQAAYQYATDDAYGEQSCPGESSITVRLCSANGNNAGSGSGSGSGSSSSSPEPTVASTTSEAETTTISTPTTTSTPTLTPTTVETTTATPTTTGYQYGGFHGFTIGENEAVHEHEKANKKSHKTTATTLATVKTAANRGGVTVTEMATKVVNSYVTATPEVVAIPAEKRHEHVHQHARHPHRHRF